MLIQSTLYDGRPRTLFSVKCMVCTDEFYVPKHCLATRKYCSVDCRNVASRVGKILINCSFCSRQVARRQSQIDKAKSGYQFCSRVCKEQAQQIHTEGFSELKPITYKSGEHIDYRQKAFDVYGKQCKLCTYNEIIKMLDVHHIDSDRSNNRIENLEVLCVWCHALKTRGII